MNPPDPTLRLKVDTAALADNWRNLDALSGEAAAGAAVKADCYGLGVETCVPALRDAGCEAFFVAHCSEVEAVAKHVPAQQIAVLHGVINAGEIAYAQGIGAAPVINSLDQASAWSAAGGGMCHLMVDTGINRLGVAPAEIGNSAVQALEIDTLLSHLACADEDSDKNAQQLAAFEEVRNTVPHARASLANSAGIALGSAYAFDLTRPGLALYGGVPRPELDGSIRQVAHVEAAILQTRTITAGDTVGYNAQFRAEKDMRVATVSLGYADGFMRSRGPGSHLLHGEKRLPILGKVSMDMIVVDLVDAPELREGDWLSVPFNLKNAAQQSGLSQYELLTTIGTRLRKS
ncbi:alanine racemase [Erythrobacter sp. YT30]|uniref:alanine racemase n=1 Tax=Erythrobacter sp. YT30 TaxID=1735012 RepID=UPI00076DF272|nr:alanine racemase [Erythrobacter sp. YT30]KWV92977.1 alanine racemase [Erythrobacter sp. YT30]